ncbi:MAG: response regulator [Trichloromonadaceae bacterium]
MVNQKNLRIVVIDDDPIIMGLLEMLLSEFGHEVLTFPDPTAYSFCFCNSNECKCPQEFPCADVIISDFSMPNMDGIEFFKLIKKKGCKIVDANKALMSAGVQSQNKDDFDALNYKFFKKPLGLDEITEWVGKCEDRIRDER